MEFRRVVFRSLTLGALSDPKCDAGTISAPSQSPISPGGSAFYTCSHTLNAVGTYVNVAVVTATPPGEPPITQEPQRTRLNSTPLRASHPATSLQIPVTPAHLPTPTLAR